jgi:hypothetical protein
VFLIFQKSEMEMARHSLYSLPRVFNAVCVAFIFFRSSDIAGGQEWTKQIFNDYFSI